MRISFFFILLLCVTSCIKGDIENYRNPHSDINIFLVEEGQLEIHASEFDIYDLELDNKPWVKDSDIEFYDWSAHCFYLKKEVDKTEKDGRHFVIVSGNKRLLTGIFWPMYMSSFPSLPAIDDIFSPSDVIRFNRFGWVQPGQLDSNLEFKKELIEAGVLREGIKVEITNIKKAGSTSINYTYKISNRDIEPIYVLDSKKMGDKHFHYYCNGVSLKKDDKYFWPNGFETAPSENIKSSWYVKIKPGSSITRSATISGYASFPSGKVKATFRFPSAHNLKAGEWKKKDGRIWFGDYIAEAELVLQ